MASLRLVAPDEIVAGKLYDDVSWNGIDTVVTTHLDGPNGETNFVMLVLDANGRILQDGFSGPAIRNARAGGFGHIVWTAAGSPS